MNTAIPFERNILEAYLLGTLSVEKTTELKSNLSRNAALKEELAMVNGEMISDFVQGTLQEPLLGSFMEKLGNDPAFADEVEREKLLQFSLKHADLLYIKKVIHALPAVAEEEAGEEASSRIVSMHPKKSAWWRPLLVAAIALLLMVPAYRMLVSTEGNAAALVAFDHDSFAAEELTATRGFAKPNPKVIFAQAKKDYAADNYASAAPAFTQLASQFPEHSILQLYAGNAYFALGEYAQASHKLASISNDKQWGDAAKWYLALSLKEMNDEPGAEKVLKMLAKERGEYAEKARALSGK